MSSAHTLIKRSVIAAYCCFLGMVALCSSIFPRVFAYYNYGISTFGSIPKTMVVYYLGFAGTIGCLVVIAQSLRQYGQRARLLRSGFLVAAVCMAGIAGTSYSQSRAGLVVHWAFALVLAATEIVLLGWSVTQEHANFLDLIPAGIFVGIVIVSLLPVVGHIAGLRSFPLRETLAFVCALWVTGRAALRLSYDTN